MHQRFLITSRSFTSLMLVLSFLLPASLFSQTKHPVASWLNAYRNVADFRSVQVMTLTADRSDLEGTVSNATILRADEDALDALLHQAPTTMTFFIPQRDGAVLALELAKVEILAPEFSLGTKGESAEENLPYHKAVHYRGVIRGDDASIAALSFTSTGLSGMVADAEGTRQLGMLDDGTGNYIFYNTRDLNASSPNSCHADEQSLLGDLDNEISAGDRGVGCKTVNIYFECDYKLYVDKGYTVTGVTNYVTSLFNQVAALYANENVGVAISQIYVWTSPDNYTGQTNIGNLLNAFRQTVGTNFNGQLAHFLSTRSLGGGIAYVDVICFKQYAFGVSCINPSFQNVPTYSWSVEVVTHELGHNLGSYHTHSCNWPGGALDNCISPEGSCAPGPAPVNGGTIMSYCHLTGAGINFNNGFGPVPGAKIRDKVLNASCLTPSGTAPSGLTTSNITANSASLGWAPVAGGTTFTVQYKITSSSTWLTGGTTTSTVYNLGNLSPNTAYSWQVKTDCSGYSATATFSTVSGSGGGGSCNPPGNTQTSSISTSAAYLSWAGVSGATSYTVQYKTSGSSSWQTAGTTGNTVYNLGGLSSGTTYNWQVKANCSNYGPIMSFVTASNGGGACAAPVNLSNNQVGSTTASISWAPVPGASSYTLQLKYANSTYYYTLGTVPSTSVSISGLQPSTAYHWRVRANCSYYSTSKILTTMSNILGDSEGNSAQSLPNVTYQQAQSVEIYPNPANDFVYLKHNAGLAVKPKVQVENASGQVVLGANLDAELYRLDVSSLPPGLYFITFFQNDRKVNTEKVVVIR